jgi:PAS domain S-box-containing protein
MSGQRVEFSGHTADAPTAVSVGSPPPATIVNSLGAIVIVLDNAGRITWANDSWSTTTGITLDEVVGKQLPDFVKQPSEKRRIAKALEKAIDQEQTLSFDCPINCQNGTDLRIKWSFTVTRDDADGGLLLTGAGVEVTDLYNEVVRLKNLLSSQTGEQPAAPAEDNRRSCDRVPFAHVVHIAPVIGRQLPPWNTFTPVRCKDLSQAGFSFFQPEPPVFSELVVVFGKKPKQCFIHGAIAHVTPVELNGNRLFVVGCEFKRRVDQHYVDNDRWPPLET